MNKEEAKEKIEFHKKDIEILENEIVHKKRWIEDLEKVK